MKTEIDKIGIEIEGEFSPVFADFLSMYGKIKDDGSVYSCKSPNKWHERHSWKLDTCEFNSRPFTYNEIGYHRRLFDSFQEAYLSGKYHFNKTAGLHIHMSFNPIRPVELISHDFYKRFIDNLKKDYPKEFKARADNSYCKAFDKITPLHDLWTGQDRYSAINFHDAQLAHKTVEFRIWPTAEPKKMYEYVRYTYKQVKSYLNKKTFSFKFATPIKILPTPKTAELNMFINLKNRTEHV